MIRYKLIKNYPQFEMPLECHSVSEREYYTNKGDRVYNPENYPEFWEKVVEKDYEILSYKCLRSNLIDPNQIFIKQDNLFCWSNVKYDESYILNNIWNNRIGGFIINSVKRLSDSEIFTIGDKVKQSNVIHNNTFTIRGFEMDVNNKHLLVIGTSGIKLSKVEKVKPIFKTEDGIDIYDNNHKLFEVILNNFHLNCNIPLIACNDSKDKRKDGYPSKVFSSKSTAEEYILLNKPCLSITDIQSIYVSAKEGYKKNGNEIGYFEELKKLVKTKL